MTVAKPILWIGLYWALVLAPVGLLLLGHVPPSGGFWPDFSTALGYSALSMLGVQFVLTARFRRASAPFGIDILYYFHRYIGIAAFAAAVGHGLILLLNNPALFGLQGKWGLPAHLYGALLAMALLGALLIASLWRKQLDIRYQGWRRWHGFLAVAVILLAAGHAAAAASYLEAPWKRNTWLAFTLAWPLLLLYVRLAKPWRRAHRPYRIEEVRAERGNAWTLRLAPEGHGGFQFSPGQFAWLTVGESPYSIEEHPFSISSSPVGDGRIEMTVKELGDFTRTIKDVPAGTCAFVDGPYGAFSTDRFPGAPGFVFLAGGVGIAPVMSMLRALAERRDKRPLLLFYCNKNWDGVIFREEFERFRNRLNLEVVHVLESPPNNWKGETGLLTPAILIKKLTEEYNYFDYFICGPIPLIRTAEASLADLGISLRRIHTELYELV